MTLPLELGGIHDPAIRRQLEIISQQFPVVVAGGGGGAETDPIASPALATHAALTTSAHGGIVASTDPRLTDARAPTAHKASHEPGGSDVLTGLTNASIAAAAGIAKTKLANLDIVNADVNAAAAIAEAKLSLATDAAAGTGSRRTIGTGALQAAAGNDARFTDARTPTAHQTTHQTGNSDALTGNLDATARSNISKAGAAVGTRRGLNLIQGTNITLTMADNAGSERVDVTIAAAGAGAPTATGAFSAYRSTALSVTTGSVITFNSEEYDVSSWFDTTTGRFTPLNAGYYRLSWSVRANAALTADVIWVTTLRKNGAAFKVAQTAWQRGTTLINSTGTVNVQANGTTDFFDIILDHSVGATTALSATAANTYFQGELIGI